jgi:hypothetical protein
MHVTWNDVYDADWDLENTYVPKRNQLSHKQTSLLLTLKELLPLKSTREQKIPSDNKLLLLTPLRPVLEIKRELVKSEETGYIKNPFGQWMWDYSRGPNPEHN